MRSTRRVLLGLLLGLAMPAGLAASQPCEVVPMPCTFEGRAFRVTVIDAETRTPLAGVHVLAEWQMYGALGRRNGPLMVQDGVTGADGSVAFPAWGPVEGTYDGLVVPYDPGITFFKPGYTVLVTWNKDGLPGQQKARVRQFWRDGHTSVLAPFHGTPDQWAAELGKAWRPRASPSNDEDLLRFRTPYLNRLQRVWAEREKLPGRFRDRGQVFWSMEGILNLLERGKR